MKTLLTVAALLVGASCARADEARDRAALLEGVQLLPKVGVPGALAVFGPDAFAVLTGLEGERPRALVAAARAGAGRAVAFAHGGYLGRESFESAGGG
ncbi:MAG: hypothetical protein KDD82_02955, partial [Planctomycetes bacterium]|nr:hypothetical protein [Planctomycetota bacterium]